LGVGYPLNKEKVRRGAFLLFGVNGVLGQFHIRYMKHGHILCLVLGTSVVPLKKDNSL
jgi:hypothetical protein